MRQLVVGAGTPEQLVAQRAGDVSRRSSAKKTPAADTAGSLRSYTAEALLPILNGEAHTNGAAKKTKRRAVQQAKQIELRGAKQHNLRGVDVKIDRDAFTVCCGPSGSGKSSLAMDTIYAEGQRRYVESLVELRPAVRWPDAETGA